jgi:transcriptional regulator with XRE-family HTH domain
MPHMGDRLETILRERDLSQSDLARMLGITRQAVCQKFAQRVWRADVIWKLAVTLEIPTDYFFTRGAATPQPTKNH